MVDDENPFQLTEEQNTQFSHLITSARNDRLMVRSTGKEDTKTLANAGGNESVANVGTTSPEIVKAAKTVVCSYFEEKSLKQRIGLQDESIFDNVIFCPVLIQRMIGEKNDQEIPSCGVMFTEEAEGGISYKNEKMKRIRLKQQEFH